MKLEMFENIVSLRSVALKTPIYIYSDPYSKQNKSKKKSERVFWVQDQSLLKQGHKSKHSPFLIF